MAIQKPMGMRMGESFFCVGYLLFALVAGIIFLLAASASTPPTRQHALR